jgi:uncharacterized alpha/beta hydrolase family protein
MVFTAVHNEKGKNKEQRDNENNKDQIKPVVIHGLRGNCNSLQRKKFHSSSCLQNRIIVYDEKVSAGGRKDRLIRKIRDETKKQSQQK